MDDYQQHEVLLAFKHRGRQMQLRASAKGWAALYLKEHPYNYRHKGGEQQHSEGPRAGAGRDQFDSTRLGQGPDHGD
ncbi:hypothetical protein [Bradyrhizobium cytisi]|uniref:Uncharacterized protein n=1 Tax=Bradyrhizobium cytisi TaxID=515489 RepID=A0A5S4VXA0_9BRAD|nr:hypothetical protein [Bradyrhizobium cytisi]TYL72059.1 hypothetical protein FXB38_39215 [Bradyrhizobium cytisi]